MKYAGRPGSRVVALAALLVLIVPASAGAFPPEREAAIQQQVEQYAAELGYPGIVAGIWNKGQGGYVATTGVADSATGRAPGADDHARIGSNTKTLTATLVLQLVERGRLHLDDRLNEFVGDVRLGQKISIRQLLNHTSGIFTTPTGLVEQWLSNPDKEFRPTQAIRRALEKPRYCRPGACYHYSNTNYLLLGEIIEGITEPPLPDLYERRIFNRLGMTGSSFDIRQPVQEPALHGYVDVNGTREDTFDWNFSLPWTAGGAASTLNDLRTWAPALATGRGVLSKRLQRKRLRMVPMPGTAGARYGLGISKIGEFFGHDGAVPGYDSFLLFSPSLDMTVVGIGNTSAEIDPVRPSPLDPESLINLANPMIEAALGQPRSAAVIDAP